MEPAMRFAHYLKTLLASLLILTLVACAPTAKREGTGEFIDDTLITTKVKAALAADPNVKATEVNVETFKGMVQLSGFVSSKESLQKALDLTRAVDGVRGVKNDMVVK
jgi:osmotically-inducible protein OsmY